MNEKALCKKVFSWASNVFLEDVDENTFYLDGSFHIHGLTAFSFASNLAKSDACFLVFVDDAGTPLAGAFLSSRKRAVAVHRNPAVAAYVFSVLFGEFSKKSDALVRYERGASAKWWQKEKWAGYWLLLPCSVVFTLIGILVGLKSIVGDNWSTVLTIVLSVFVSEYLSKKYGFGYLSDGVRNELLAREVLAKARGLVSEN